MSARTRFRSTRPSSSTRPKPAIRGCVHAFLLGPSPATCRRALLDTPAKRLEGVQQARECPCGPRLARNSTVWPAGASAPGARRWSSTPSASSCTAPGTLGASCETAACVERKQRALGPRLRPDPGSRALTRSAKPTDVRPRQADGAELRPSRPEHEGRARSLLARGLRRRQPGRAGGQRRSAARGRAAVQPLEPPDGQARPAARQAAADVHIRPSPGARALLARRHAAWRPPREPRTRPNAVKVLCGRWAAKHAERERNRRKCDSDIMDGSRWSDPQELEEPDPGFRDNSPRRAN